MTPAQQKALDAYLNTGKASAAAYAAGVHRITLYRWRKDDPEFARAWEEARGVVVDILEDEALRRAVEGIDEPIYYQGSQVGVVRRYSDTLLSTLLRANAPEKYRENSKLELTGAGGGPLQIDDTTAAARIAALLEAARHRREAAPLDEFA